MPRVLLESILWHVNAGGSRRVSRLIRQRGVSGRCFWENRLKVGIAFGWLWHRKNPV
jgi:hypothetical protein